MTFSAHLCGTDSGRRSLCRLPASLGRATQRLSHCWSYRPSAGSHRVSHGGAGLHPGQERQQVDCSVDVSIVLSTAYAGPAAHGYREIHSHLPASRASLATREPRGCLHHLTAIPPRLVCDLSDELAPTGVGNGFRQVVVAQQARDVQALQRDRLVLRHETRCELVEAIFASVGYASVHTRYPSASLASIIRAFVLAVQRSLSAGKLPLVTRKVAGVRDLLAFRGSQPGAESEVQCCSAVDRRQRRDHLVHKQRDKGSPCGITSERHGRRITTWGQPPRPAHPELTDLGQAQQVSGFVPFECGSCKFGGLPTVALAFEHWCASLACAPVDVSSGKVTERLLQWDARHVAQPAMVVLALECGQIGRGLAIGQAALTARCTAPLLDKQRIPDPPNAPERPPHHGFLFRRWVDTEAVSPLGHRSDSRTSVP